MDMDELGNKFAEVRDDSRANRESRDSFDIGGYRYTIEAKTKYRLFNLFPKKTKMTVSVGLGDKNIEVCGFDYNEGKGLSEIQKLETKAKRKIEKELRKEIEACGNGTTTVDAKGETNGHVDKVNEILTRTEEFIQKSDLSKERIASLRELLTNLCSKPIVEYHAGDTSSKIKSLQILLDAKELRKEIEACSNGTTTVDAKGEINEHVDKVNEISTRTEEFIQRNDLSKEGIASLRESLTNLCSKPIVEYHDDHAFQ
jgi:hypothetical protein